MALKKQELIGFNSQFDHMIPENQKIGLAKKTLNVLWDEFQIDIDEEGRVPKGEGNVPRVMVFGRGANGEMGFFDPNELGIRPDSPEFVSEAEKGNVFVYPAGAEKPVQLQAYPTGPKNTDLAKFGVTDPVEPEQLPQVPVPKMGFWRNVARVLTFGLAYLGRARAIARAQRANAANGELVRNAVQQRHLTGHKERDERDALIQKRAERALQAERNKDLKDANLAVEVKNIGLDQHISILRPEPEFRTNLEKPMTADGKPMNGKWGIYTKNHFKDLTVFAPNAEELAAQQEQEFQKLSPEEQGKFKRVEYVKFDKNSIKPDGVNPLTDEEFAAVAMFTCWKPEHAIKEYERGNDYDPTLREALKECGYNQEQVDKITTINCRSMATTDNFYYVAGQGGRDGEGEKFSYYVNPARKEAAEAFKAYANGDKKPLAALIANGINTASDEFHDLQSNRLGYNTYGALMAAEGLFSLMEKDPDLKNIALNLDKGKMEPDRLKFMEGMRKVNELENGDREAMKTIATARANKTELSEEQKKDCAKKIIISRLAMQQISNNYLTNVKPLDKDNSVWQQKAKPVMKPELYTMPKNQWPKPEKGTIYYNSIQNVVSGMHRLYAPMPQIGKQLAEPAEVQKLEQLAEKIVEQENLKNLSTDQLFSALNAGNGTLKLTDAMNRVVNPEPQRQPVLQQNQPVLQQNQPNLNQNRQVGGPQPGGIQAGV